MSRAWVVTDDYIDRDDGNVLPIHAETRGQARVHAASELGIDFVETFQKSFRIRRAKEFDDRPFNDYELLTFGYYGWTQCQICQRRIYSGHEEGLPYPFSYAFADDAGQDYLTLWDEDEPDCIEAHSYGSYMRCGVCHAKDRTMADVRRAYEEQRRQREAQNREASDARTA